MFLSLRLAAIMSLLLVTAVAPCYAQTTGTLRAVILDSSGASVPNAAITISGTSNQRRSATSNGEGVLSLMLPPGDYTVQAVAPGFAVAQAKVTIAAGRISQADIHLVVTLEGQQVTV